MFGQTHDTDLPRRTWRQWWLSCPKWFRIGAWATVGLLALHVALAIRFAIGLQESAEITNFRDRAYRMKYFWDPDADDVEPFKGHGLLMSGLWGRSGRNIESVYLIEGATDDDLAFLGKNCPNIRWLHATYANATSEGLKSLRPCRRLVSIDLTDAELFDEAMEFFLAFPDLQDLQLCGTGITNTAIPMLKRIPKLNYLDVSYTDVSSAAVRDWDVVDNPDGLDSVIRARMIWSDGTLGTAFEGFTKLTFESHGMDKSNISRNYDKMLGTSRRFLGEEMTSWVSELEKTLPDGDYQFQITLGNYESSPFVVSFKDGCPSTRMVEFQMPVTKAEAEKPVATFAIRWSDGRTDWPRSEHWGNVKITSTTNPLEESTLHLSMVPHYHFRFEWEKLKGCRDGEYQLVLQLKRCKSAPVTVTFQNGQPTTELIEFRMPMTKAEATKKDKSNVSRIRKWSWF